MSVKTTAIAARPGLLQPLRIVAGVVALLVIVQAVFAGRGQFVDNDMLTLHGQIGNLTFLMVLAQVALAFAAGIRTPVRGAVVGTSVALLVLVVVQIGLGYSGREGGEAAAWHIPNGVLIFGLTMTMMSLLARLRREG